MAVISFPKLCIFLPFWILLCSPLLIKGASDNNLESAFRDFISKYSKQYYNISKEYWYRFDNFKESLKRTQYLNEKAKKTGENALYGITKYSDMSPGEFKAKVLDPVKPKVSVNAIPRLNSFVRLEVGKSIQAPEIMDWRSRGVVTAVKDQKNCGACWAFSTVEVMESMRAIKHGNLLELSVQQLIDCAFKGQYGCNGGDTCRLVRWLDMENYNVTTEADYPLTDVQGTCRSASSQNGVQIASNYSCGSYVNLEEMMLGWLAVHGPIVSAVDATTWQDYLGGIIQYHCEAEINHAVEIVGYNLAGEVPYYIVRNSWGVDFGLAGYLHIAVGKNLCGIAEQVTVLDVK